MIKLKHGEVNNRAFTDALRRLVAQPLPGKLAYKVLKIIEKIEKELSIQGKLLAELPAKFGKKDAEGKPVFDEAGNLVTEDEKKAEFVKELSDIMNVEFTVAVSPIEDVELENLTKAEISVQDLMTLKPLMAKEAQEETLSS